MIAKVIYCFLFIFLNQPQVFSAIEIARIGQRIIPILNIKKTSDMYFPDAFPGSPSYTIEAGNSETAQNASFLLTGEPNKRVNIILPTQRIILQNGKHQAKIYVHNFRSNVGQTSQLNNDGELKLFIGATREEIPNKIPSGDYSGNFYVTVLY